MISFGRRLVGRRRRLVGRCGGVGRDERAYWQRWVWQWGCGCWSRERERVSSSSCRLAAGHGFEMVPGRMRSREPPYERCTRNYIITWSKSGRVVVETSWPILESLCLDFIFISYATIHEHLHRKAREVKGEARIRTWIRHVRAALGRPRSSTTATACLYTSSA
jgi:hypothetical protein